MKRIVFRNGNDILHLAEIDRKAWYAISMPVKGVRFDGRMLELMDTDGDGRIRADEVLGAIEFLKSRDFDFETLFKPVEGDEAALADVIARQTDLAAAEPSAEDKAAIAAWQEGEAACSFLGENTAKAEDALASFESKVDAFFLPADDVPLVSDEDEKPLPLDGRLNPRFADAILDFMSTYGFGILGGERSSLTRREWLQIKDAFAPYRAWRGSRPVVNADLKGRLDDEERVIRYRMHMLEFLENYANMRRLYDRGRLAIFQTGTLRIDGKELNLCFHVADEAAHSALVEKSMCCIIYLKLSRPGENAARNICAAVTAGAIGRMYVGRNGVFYDRDGKDWEAVITKIIEAQVSLVEAFWSPWKKLGEAIGGMMKKFLGDKQGATVSKLNTAEGGGAAMASSVAAIGIGVGMVGAAAASVLAAVSGMTALQIAIAVVALVLIVSMPSVILTWFRLRRRDIGVILNACGWAINRPMHFSMSRARAFTICG